MKTLSERNRILNEVKDSCYLAFFDGNPEEGGKEILTGRKKVNFPVATNGYVKSTNQLDFTGGEEDTIAFGETSQSVYSGKNLINIDTFDIGGLYRGVANPYMHYRINNSSSPIKVSPNTTYTISAFLSNQVKGMRVGVHQCDSNLTFKSDSSWKQLATDPFTFTTGSDIAYVKLIFSLSTTSTSVSTGGTENTTAFEDVNEWLRGSLLQMEEGSSGTEYEQFCGATISPNPMYPQNVVNIAIGSVELNKIVGEVTHNVYEDYLFTENGKWYKHEVMKKVVLDGTETWNLASTVNPRYPLGVTLNDKKPAPNQNTNAEDVICNKFFPKSNSSENTQEDKDIFSFRGNAGKVVWFFSPKGYFSGTTAQEIKDEFSARVCPIVLYYRLDTPNDVEITDQATIAAIEEAFGSATGVAKYWGIYDSEIGGKLLYYYILPYEVRIVKDSTITIKAGNCILKEG